ncbi:peptide chain release factor N(5)-glutamine methyltransferase [Caldithrix abyssi]
MEKRWKVIELLQTVSDFLKEKGIENPRLNAELLLGKVLGLTRVDLYLAFERPLSVAELNAYRELVRRRAKHEPLQYILEETEFMGLKFTVKPGVLIPRPETELLVEEVLKLKNKFALQPTIVDIGTGSGCIALSLAHYWQEARVFATDLSFEALEIFKINRELNQLNGRVTAVNHDLMDAWPGSVPAKFEILVSNPPYIRFDEIKTLPDEVQKYEPILALTDQADGLSFYRRFFELIQKNIIHPAYMFLEMSGSQPEKIINLAEQAKIGAIEVIEDLNNIKRILKIRVEK